MKVYSIEWHEECLKNRERHYIEKRKDIDHLIKEIEEDARKIRFYEYQINEAKKINKEKFDPDRFRVKKS